MKQKPYDTLSLAHTSWKCQYHTVFMPKHCRKEIYRKLKVKEYTDPFKENWK